MYILVNSADDMSHGKLAAQAAHAAVEAYNLSRSDLISAWYEGGHHTKIILDGGNSHDLLIRQKYIEARDFRTKLIIDEGRTEIRPFTPTAIGVAIVDRDDPHVAATFESFRTLKPSQPNQKPIKKRSWFRGRG